MTYTKSAFFLALTFALTGCAAATENVETLVTVDEAHAVDTAKAVSHAEKHRHHATVKPGASVTLNSVLPKSMTSGSFQTVQLRFDEAYESGPLSIKVETTGGLSLFGGASSKTFDMNDSNEHVWDVDVKADVDGVYFLNVFAEAGGQARVFSVRLNVGKTTQKMFDDAMPAGGELVEGGTIRVMDATETIK